MPGRDKTGPQGEGPNTGRGLGPCGGDKRQGRGEQTEQRLGLGRRRGQGRGRSQRAGRGQGRGRGPGRKI